MILAAEQTDSVDGQSVPHLDFPYSAMNRPSFAPVSAALVASLLTASCVSSAGSQPAPLITAPPVAATPLPPATPTPTQTIAQTATVFAAQTATPVLSTVVASAAPRVTPAPATVTPSLAQETFSFGIQGDSHPERVGKMFDAALYARTLRNVAEANPSFYVMMGDDFSIEREIETGNVTQTSIDRVYLQQKQYLAGLPMPIYLVNGNHEQEARYLLDGTNNNPAILARNARAHYFTSPGADTGYYAFTRGNALFVVIDFYWHSTIAVDNTAGADRAEGKKARNLWDITLGAEQYEWFRKTLAESAAKFKFVFAHHVLGTGRGGIEEARLYEWGGRNAKGVWEFDRMRPGWEMPIHNLMVKHGVTIFFQGHDHLFARQVLDGVVYQSVPSPADPTYTAFNRDAYLTGETLPNSGYVRVTVSADQARVDYIRSFLPRDETAVNRNGAVAFAYTVP